MQIIRSKNFLNSLSIVTDYIAKDSLDNAISFMDTMDSKIDNLVYLPYKYRKSFYYDNENIRDLIFKGYTIPYLVDSENNKIVILDIFKWTDR
jgi:plasmid stabilization system protein ParE